MISILFWYVYVIINVCLSCYVRPPIGWMRWSTSLSVILLLSRVFPLHCHPVFSQGGGTAPKWRTGSSVLLSYSARLFFRIWHYTNFEFLTQLEWTGLWINELNYELDCDLDYELELIEIVWNKAWITVNWNELEYNLDLTRLHLNL